MKIRNKEFNISPGNRAYIMGILNVTPDSFSDGGRYNNLEKMMEHVDEMVRDGVDIIDVGGESTRPGYTMIDEEEEIKRVVPAIKAIRRKYDIPISIDTYKSKVAREALDAGADIINDIWGLKYDPNMKKLAGERAVPVILMHNRRERNYKDFLKDVRTDLEESIQLALNAGIKKENIILDPGIGFAKDTRENLVLTNNLEILMGMGYPVLYAASRKRMIGDVLEVEKNEREEGTMALSVYAMMKGAAFVRVHNVKGNVQALKMIEAVRNSKI